MAILEVKNWEGESIGKVILDLPEAKASTAQHVVHRAVVQERANSRQGTASTKTRAEVRGGGRKPWRQKGTGRARAGSNRSPLWRGGGVAFGPKPRDYSIKMNRKEKRLALRTAFQRRAEDVIVVDNFEKQLPRPKTKDFVGALNRLENNISGKKILLILEKKQDNVYLSARNLPNVKVISANHLSIVDILTKDLIIVTRQALDLIASRLAPPRTSDRKGIGKLGAASEKLHEQNLLMQVSSRVGFPDKVQVGGTYSLEVFAETVEKRIQFSSSKIDVWILVSPEDFELKSPEFQILEIELRSDEKKPSVTFELVPKQTGTKRIKIDFLQGTRYLARQEIFTEAYHIGKD